MSVSAVVVRVRGNDPSPESVSVPEDDMDSVRAGSLRAHPVKAMAPAITMTNAARDGATLRIGSLELLKDMWATQKRRQHDWNTAA